MFPSYSKLKWAVESAHNCSAKFSSKVTVHEKRNGSTRWYGIVYIFDLIGHPKAYRAYVWTIDAFMGHETQLMTVLQHGRICTPEDAIRTALDKFEDNQ
jgi:hypothetical protein